MMKRFYLLMAVVGTVVPWFFFASFIASEGLNIPLFVSELFANDAAGGFSADILIAVVVFWVWSYADARKLMIKNWWWVLPAVMTVGLSLALPLYLYMREDATSA